MRMARLAFPCYNAETRSRWLAPHVHIAKVTYVSMEVAAKVKQQAKGSMVTPLASPAMTPAARKPLSFLLLSLSLPVLLLLLSLVFLLSHTTFSLLICPLLPRPSLRRNATSTSSSSSASLGVSMERTLQAFHASPPPSRRNVTTTGSSSASLGVSIDDKTVQAFPALAAVPPPPLPAAPGSAVKISKKKKASAKRNKSLLKLLLRSTPQMRRFAARAEELFASREPCTGGRFFMTWLSPLAQFGRRELLVLESLFRWHGRGACLLVASDTMDTAGGRDKLSPFLERGFRVAVAAPDFAYLLNGTAASAWLAAVQRGGVSPGSIPLGQNLSNLLRLSLLYRYGGVYLDADVVVLRPFSGLRNAIGAQAVDDTTGEWRRLNNAVMVFDRGHPLLREFIAEFAAGFDGSKWGHNGPYLVSRVAARLRHHRSPVGLDLTVLPPGAFYPVHWSKIGGLFVAPKDRKEERWVKAKVENIKGGSFGIHLWNRESRRLEMEEGSVIGRLISDSCLFCNSSMLLKQE